MSGCGIKFSTRGKSLGGNLSAIGRRRVPSQRARMAAFRARRRRLSRLNNSGVGMQQLSRSCVSSAVSWGVSAVGVANAPLMSWRRTIARACAADCCGKKPDFVLVVADNQEGDTLDPGFAAHALPLWDWAAAIWENWNPHDGLRLAFSQAKQRLASNKRVWSNATAPATAVLASLGRIGWTAPDFDEFRNDRGVSYDLASTSPSVFRDAMHDSVRRWQQARIADAFPGSGLDYGIRLRPLRSLLRVSDAAHDWGPQERAQLRSALVGEQWPQDRL